MTTVIFKFRKYLGERHVLVLLCVICFTRNGFCQSRDTIYFVDHELHVSENGYLTVMCFSAEALYVNNEKSSKRLILHGKIRDTVEVCGRLTAVDVVDKRSGVYILLFSNYTEGREGLTRMIYFEDENRVKLQYKRNGQFYILSGNV